MNFKKPKGNGKITSIYFYEIGLGMIAKSDKDRHCLNSYTKF